MDSSLSLAVFYDYDFQRALNAILCSRQESPKSIADVDLLKIYGQVLNPLGRTYGTHDRMAKLDKDVLQTAYMTTSTLLQFPDAFSTKLSRFHMFLTSRCLTERFSSRYCRRFDMGCQRSEPSSERALTKLRYKLTSPQTLPATSTELTHATK